MILTSDKFSSFNMFDETIFKKFHDKISEHFNLSELNSLAFELGIKFESLPGTTIEDKSRELILYCKRHDNLPTLVVRCQQHRPVVEWPNIDFAQKDIGTVYLEPFIAHYYTLSLTHGLVGRKSEIASLNKWVSSFSYPSVLCIAAIGGMGKSTLAWHLFNNVPLASDSYFKGKVWWSFYDSDSRFESFITASLAYVSNRSFQEVESMPLREQEELLIKLLDKDRFLFVLDGFERTLIGYAPEKTDRNTDCFESNLRLAKMANPRYGVLLRRLATLKASRILITSRLYPSDLRDRYTNDIIPNTLFELNGLSDTDSLDLWKEIGLQGNRHELVKLFNTFGNHPLVLKALAGAIKNYRNAPGDVKKWLQNQKGFDPFTLQHVQEAMSHVLSFAFLGLTDSLRELLYVISAFHSSPTYDTLNALLVVERTVFNNGNELDSALTELDARGLIGWNKKTNQYTLHPVVKGVAWTYLSKESKKSIYASIQSHFETVQSTLTWRPSSLEELAPIIELYNALIAQEKYEAAVDILQTRIYSTLLYQIGNTRLLAELFEKLIPDRSVSDSWEPYSEKAKSFIFRFLAHTYHRMGLLSQSYELYDKHQKMSLSKLEFADSLDKMADALRVGGKLALSESKAMRALELARELEEVYLEAIALWRIGLSTGVRGLNKLSLSALTRSVKIFDSTAQLHLLGGAHFFLAQREIWFGNFESAFYSANRAWELAHVRGYERDFPRASRLQGVVAMNMQELDRAEERIQYALMYARKIDFLEEELQSLITLAEISYMRDDLQTAKNLLDEILNLADEGPFPLAKTDAYNLLSQTRRKENDIEGAIKASLEAYHYAYCDGPPFTYFWGLELAKKTLIALNRDVPLMQFSKPILENTAYNVNVNPKDDYYVSIS